LRGRIDVKWHERPLAQKLTTWLIFGVVIALTPFILEFLKRLGREQEMSLGGVLGTGQLLLVSAAIAAGATGELVLVEVPSRRRLAKLITIGCCVLSVIVSSLWFGDISGAIQEGKPPDPSRVSNGSIFVFIFTLISSAGCLALSLADASGPSLKDSDDTDELHQQLLQAQKQLKEAK
jgi:hypothetical protein